MVDSLWQWWSTLSKAEKKEIEIIQIKSQKVYKKGITLTKKEMKAIEKRLERHPNLPKWDIFIRPSCR